MTENDKNQAAKNVMVVGGGIAGMQASLDLAEQGFKVYLVESSPSIGGKMAMLDKTFPTNDCSTCMISPKLVEVARHENIEILTMSELTAFSGEPGAFKATVTEKSRYINPQKCVGCGICAEKCPKKVDDEFNQSLNKRKAVYLRYPQAVPLIYTIDPEHCIYLQKGKCRACEKFCQNKAIDFEQKETVRELEIGALIAAPGFDLAPGDIRPELGYGRWANVVTSLEFERLLSASGPTEGHVVRPSDKQEPRRVAWIQCVGSRDASLGREYCSYVCCMYATKQAILAREHVTGLTPSIFYMDIRAQGKGFDRYYERAKNEQGVNYVRSMISRVVENPATGDLEIEYYDEADELKTETFDLVVLSLGMQPAAQTAALAGTLNIETDQYGFNAQPNINPLLTSREGVFACGAFQAPRDIPDTVMQASGAAARAAALLGQAGPNTNGEKPAVQEKDVSGQPPRIGVFVCHCGTNIASVVDVPSVVEYTQTLPYVEYATNLLFACSTDSHARIAELIKEHDLNRVVVASCSPRTHEALFQSTLKEAGLNPYLFEMANIRDQCSWVHAAEPEKATEKARDLVRMAVARAAVIEPLHKLPVQVQRSGLVLGGGLAGLTTALALAEEGYPCHLVEKSGELGGMGLKIPATLEGFDVKAHTAGLIEAARKNPLVTVHLNARLAKTSGHVGKFVSEIEADGKTQRVAHGALVVATGASEYTPSEHLYGTSERVMTQQELAEALEENQAAPLKAKSVVMIQCVGSRSEEHPYCSRICCAKAVANALKLKKLNPETEVTILFRDMRTFSKKELYYLEARRLGVRFIRFDPERAPEPALADGRLTVKAYDTILGEWVELEADLLALSAAVRPGPDVDRLVETLKLQKDADGFFMEAHLKLRPVDFASAGFFMAGSAHAPKFVEETIAQAQAAAARASAVLAKSQIQVGGQVAVVDPSKCAACLTCVRTCPYGVPVVKQFNAEIDPALCHGCGACVSECPGKAITLMHSTDAQILAKTHALSG